MLLFSTKFPSEIAAALGLATSTPLTEGGRKTQRALQLAFRPNFMGIVGILRLLELIF